MDQLCVTRLTSCSRLQASLMYAGTSISEWVVRLTLPADRWRLWRLDRHRLDLESYLVLAA